MLFPQSIIDKMGTKLKILATIAIELSLSDSVLQEIETSKT